MGHPKRGTHDYEMWILTQEYKEFCEKARARKRPDVSERQRGENNPNFGGKSVTEYQRRVTSERMSGENHPLYGTHHTLEWRLAQSERMKGDNNPSRKNPPWNAGKRSPQTSREKHHNWKGGISHTSYPWTFLSRRKFYRMLYGNICFECNKTPEKNGRNLTVHHYDYDKNSTNCIPLCHSCNSKANYNRSYWEKHYTEAVKEYWEWIVS